MKIYNNINNNNNNNNCSSQLTKDIVPNDVLLNFLNKLGDSDANDTINANDTIVNAKKKYIITKNIFKKAVFNNLVSIFIESLKPYYRPCKHYFLNRTMTYTNFLIIIRQLCNINNNSYTIKKIYDKSKYELEYTIVI